MASPVDVGGLPNHVKYCVSVLSFQWINIRTSPVGIPYTNKVLNSPITFTQFLHRLFLIKSREQSSFSISFSLFSNKNFRIS